MYILGLNAYHADGSAVLLRDGELIVAVEEERFRRVKHWAGFPSETIGKCLGLEVSPAKRLLTSQSVGIQEQTSSEKRRSPSPTG